MFGCETSIISYFLLQQKCKPNIAKVFAYLIRYRQESVFRTRQKQFLVQDLLYFLSVSCLVSESYFSQVSLTGLMPSTSLDPLKIISDYQIFLTGEEEPMYLVSIVSTFYKFLIIFFLNSDNFFTFDDSFVLIDFLVVSLFFEGVKTFLLSYNSTDLSEPKFYFPLPSFSAAFLQMNLYLTSTLVFLLAVFLRFGQKLYKYQSDNFFMGVNDLFLYMIGCWWIE